MLGGVSYTNPPNSFEDLLKMAQDFVDHRSRGYVNDGMVFARWILGDGKQALENLALVQARCTALLEENRALRSAADELPATLMCGQPI
jgi:hypothetical protein